MTLLNIYLIENLHEIKIKYRLFKVRGILRQSEEFEKNVQFLSDRLSRMTKSPCIAIKEDEELYIAQPVGCPDLPSRLPLIGTETVIEPTELERELDYGCLTETNKRIATRFLQFYLVGALHENPKLWRPSAGMPYFHKDPDPHFRTRDAAMYRGFKIRLVTLPRSKIGVCIDITRKYASRYYLPSNIAPDQFRRYKRKKCIYEFGHRWYEIRISGISGLNVSEEKMPDGSSLFDYIHSKVKGYKPQALLSLSIDCTVLTYQTSLGATRRVPSALCRLTYATNHPAVSKYHSKTILPPYRRKREIEFVVRTYLRGWKFQGIPIVLSKDMLKLDCPKFIPPDLEFGGGKILSLKQTKGAIPSRLDDFGSAKWRLLHSMDAGFFVKKPLDRQYIVIPKSMYETCGTRYLDDLKMQFTRLYSPNGESQYDPIVITYDDSVRQSVYTLGNEILQSVLESVSRTFFYAGYGLVIVPKLDPKRPYIEDELANLLMSEFRKKGIFVSISHTEVPSASYMSFQTENGETGWRVIDDERRARAFRGYLENVVLNKILLLNHCWPFVLAQPLNSDLIIGLDVKSNMAGFLLIFKDGRTFTFKTSKSDQKEQLSRGHVSTVIYDYLKKELSGESIKIRDITLHRDGRLYPGEIKGMKDALNRLAKEGIIEEDYNCNFVEIKKTSRVPIRFFDTTTPQGSMQEMIENPMLGTHMMFGNNAFLCTTGRPFKFHGTANPLQVTKIEGDMDFKLILEDVFSLANLTWTKPSYCSKLPISLKMAHIRLKEIAGEYDEDKLRFMEEEV